MSEARQRAAQEMARRILPGGENFSGTRVHAAGAGDPSAEATAQAEAASAPIASADAGARGIEPEVRKTPGEELAGMIFYGEGVPAEPWRRGL
jgi:hypothetical protein